VTKPKFFDSHLFYDGVRRAFLGGFRVKPILQALDMQKGESLLDAGCGYGVMRTHFTTYRYTGIDLSPERIEWASKRYPDAAFSVRDAAETGFAQKTFDKTLCYGLLHHLSDTQAAQCLEELRRVTKKRIVFSDPVYSRLHFLNNLLCRLDRGNYVRWPNGYDTLLRAHFSKIKVSFFHSRNGLAKYVLHSVEMA
jgi:SAM-dependent methyltransferase